MKGLRYFFLVVLVLGVCNYMCANYIQILPERSGIGKGLAEGTSALAQALEKRAEVKRAETNVTETKACSLASWTGGRKKICRKCYEENFELKKRVELTSLIALQLQSVGYSLKDSVETAKTAVIVDWGK